MLNQKRSESPYLVSLDFDNEDLRKIAIAFIMEGAFIEKLCIIEQHDDTPEEFQRLPYNLYVFNRGDDYDSVTQYCLRKLEHSPRAVFIHIGSAPVRCDALHLVGVSEEFFTEYFSHLVGLCFLTHSVKESVSTIKDMLVKSEL